jgi:hypothetical protein
LNPIPDTIGEGCLDFAAMRSNNASSMSEQRDFGDQPLIAVMERWGLDSHALVEASEEQLTHKQVQRARSGRRLTLKMMMKVARALNVAIWNRLGSGAREQFVEYLHKDIFSYSKGFDPSKPDPNLVLAQAPRG